eukprot:97758-Chlamydomonas_euryale.AAC.4
MSHVAVGGLQAVRTRARRGAKRGRSTEVWGHPGPGVVHSSHQPWAKSAGVASQAASTPARC